MTGVVSLLSDNLISPFYEGEARIYFDCMDEEYKIWNELQPLLNIMEKDILVALERHKDAEGCFGRMVQTFNRGCKATHDYGFRYGRGPLRWASDRILEINSRIRRHNEGMCLPEEGPPPDALSFELPKNLPYIEITRDSAIFENGLKRAEANEIQRKNTQREAGLWEG